MDKEMWCNLFMFLMPIFLLVGFVLMFVNSKYCKKTIDKLK